MPVGHAVFLHSAFHVARWLPTEIVAALDAFKPANPQSGIAGIHLFPFGGIAPGAEGVTGAQRSAARPQPGPLPRGKRPWDEDGDPVRAPGNLGAAWSAGKRSMGGRTENSGSLKYFHSLV